MSKLPAANIVLAIGGLNGFVSTEVQNSTFVLLLKFSTKNPAHRQYAARWLQSMGIAKHLKSGKISINISEKQIEISDEGIIIPYNSITDTEWGQVYEKYVGQILEDEGYDVVYNGLEKGFLDRGIDLIARKEDKLNFVQCKYVHQTISKSRIEWILYKASGILFDTYRKERKKLYFTLIVNSKDTCFSKRLPKNFKLNFTETSKIEYPMLQYFLDHNHIQDKIKLEFREIQMTT